MRILVTGAAGLLGGESVRAFEGAGHEVIAMRRADLDVADLDSVMRSVPIADPDVIVHCAAMTDVDACERDPERCESVNALGAGYLAEAADEADCKLISVSTDYVFDGTKGAPYVESDHVSPLQVYGRSKALGERLAAQACQRHFVVRSAWIYGVGGKNFLSRLFDYVRADAPLRLICDQIGSPAYAPDLAASLVELAESDDYGLHHITNEGVCSWAEICRYVLDLAGISHAYPNCSYLDIDALAPRPASTPLASQRRPMLRHWREAAADFVKASG